MIRLYTKVLSFGLVKEVSGYLWYHFHGGMYELRGKSWIVPSTVCRVNRIIASPSSRVDGRHSRMAYAHVDDEVVSEGDVEKLQPCSADQAGWILAFTCSSTSR